MDLRPEATLLRSAEAMLSPSEAVFSKRVVIIGLGRVGLVNAACLAAEGHEVIGIDQNPEVVSAINRGECPFFDPELGGLIAKTVKRGALKAELQCNPSLQSADFIFCCVATPFSNDHNADLSQLRAALEQIGDALKSTASHPIVIVRSTVPPETTSSLVIPMLEARSGCKCHQDFDVAVVPEFLREGNAVSDFKSASRTIIGAASAASFKRVADLLSQFSELTLQTTFELAELAKLTDNAWHSTKIAFANEMGNIASAYSQDSRKLLDFLCLDQKLNLSSAYLRPGFAFGGPCLPKDLNILSASASAKGVATPLVSGVGLGNCEQIERARCFVHTLGIRRITLFGAAFKTGTNRFTGSPQLALLEMLHQDGFEILVHASGAERDALSQSEFDAPVCASIKDAAAFADLALIGAVETPILSRLEVELHDTQVLDLSGYPSLVRTAKRYHGVNWVPANLQVANKEI